MAWLAMLTLTGVAYQPDLPRSTWFGQWAPELGQFDTFPGTVQDVHLDDMFLPGGRLVASGSVRARLLTHRYTIRVSLVSGPPTDGASNCGVRASGSEASRPNPGFHSKLW